MDINWKRSKLRKLKHSKCSTPGKSKTKQCQAMPEEKIYAKRSRSYKMDGYIDWCNRTRKQDFAK